MARLFLKAPQIASHDWHGFYLGAHTGYGFGNATAASDPQPLGNHFGGQTGGLQAGYNWMATSRALIGLETDITFPNYLGSNAVVSRSIANGNERSETYDYAGSVRLRAGLISGNWLTYVTGGFAYLGERFVEDPDLPSEHKSLHIRTGWIAGVGLEHAMSDHWRTRIEYLYSRFGDAHVQMSATPPYLSATDFHSIRIGLNRRLDAQAIASTEGFADTKSDRWEVHGQTTYVGQGHPAFRSPYAGPNSLSPNRDYKATWSGGLYFGLRLWEGGEAYFNPEFAQGYGFNNTVGLAGFSNGEAQKSNFPYPHYNTTRLFLRQTFGLGGEQEMLASEPGQLSGKVDVSRITVQVGKFAVTDVFDGNAYAKDTRRDFMNWSIWAPGAFDYSADRVGLTYGATVELNQRDWTMRAGYFLIGSESNANHFDMRVGQRGTYALELERRYTLLDRPGAIRAIGWFNSAHSGSYRETLNSTAFGTDITATRRGRIKYGYVLNFEQEVADDIGLFGRWSWNDGKTEIMAFTDIDASLSLGTSIKGSRWGRAQDTIGIAGAFNGLSRDHRDFIAAGGMGVLIGDGRLNYRNERVLEAYYAYAINKQLTLTADYQLITNPAYNADRGPVSIFSGRLYGRF